jgi:hypothetical protein
MQEAILWIALLVGQIFSAGNMNHQQEIGMHEINPIYPKYPSKERIYYTKGAEAVGVYGLTKMFPKHKNNILKVANIGVYGFIISDKLKGISMSVVF